MHLAPNLLLFVNHFHVFEIYQIIIYYMKSCTITDFDFCSLFTATETSFRDFLEKPYAYSLTVYHMTY